MAAVTTLTPVKRHVWGDCVVEFFTISGASGSTLLVGLGPILFVSTQPGTLITAFAVVGNVVNGQVNGNILTFTSSAPMVNEKVMIVSSKG